MILMKYTKIEGAEFISHIDTLRHIGRTLTRAKIDCSFSKGFNPHKNINLSSPLPLGLKSVSEYCVIDTTESEQTFMQKFNDFSPKGIKCIACKEIDKKVNVADLIEGALYEIELVKDFNLQEFNSKTEMVVVDKRGKEFNLYDRVKSVTMVDNRLIALLNFGRNNLRIDDFLKAIDNLGANVVKIAGYVQDKNFDELYF